MIRDKYMEQWSVGGTLLQGNNMVLTKLDQITQPALSKDHQLHELINAVKLQDQRANDILKAARSMHNDWLDARNEASKLREELLINHGIQMENAYES